MSAELRVTRQGIGVELHRRPFEILLDGAQIGTITWQETFAAPIQAGRHSLRLRSGRYASRDCAFDIPEDEIANFQCHGAMMWPRYVISLVMPDWAISLRHL